MTAVHTLLSSALLVAATAQAQSPSVGMFFDAAGTQTTIQVNTAQYFDIFVVVADPVGGVDTVEMSVHFSPELIIFQTEFLYPWFGLVEPSCWIVRFSPCLTLSGSFAIAKLRTATFNVPPSADLTACVGGMSASSFSGEPGYWDCAEGPHVLSISPRGQGVYPDGCSVVNPSGPPPVETCDTSWSSVKATFRGR